MVNFSFSPTSFSDCTYSARLKRYPDGTSVLLVSSRPIFRPEGWEAKPVAKNLFDDSCEREFDNFARSVRRARAMLNDIARSTDFKFFVTLTLDKEKISRYDFPVIIKRLNYWLDNRVRRNGLAYILVPERHKDGAIHFHGFFNEALPVVDSGHFDKNGHKVYNLPAWDFGFSTAIELYGEYSSAVGYVCKYIGKTDEKIGGRWYYSGGKLGKPVIEYYNIDFDDALSLPNAYFFESPEARASFVRVESSNL